MIFQAPLVIGLILMVSILTVCIWQWRIFQKTIQQQQAIIAHYPDGLVLIDSQHKVIYHNQVAAALTGQPHQSWLGQPFQQMFRQGPALSTWQEIGHHIITLPSEDHQPGQSIYLQIQSLDAKGYKRNSPQSLITIRDITAVKQLEAQLYQDKAFAEEASRKKSAFFAKLNHELRTPLNAIIGYSEILQEHIDQLDKKRSIDYFKRIEQSGLTLNEMINALADIAKIEAGQKSLNLSHIVVPTFVNKTVFMAQLTFTESQDTLQINCQDELDHLYADEVLLRRALTFIIKTTVKARPLASLALVITQQEIDSTATPTISSSMLQWISFHICDYPTDQATLQTMLPIADLIQTLETTIPDNRPDLAISHRFCQLMGGGITIFTTPQGGSIVSIHLPVTPNQGEAPG